MAEMVDNGSSSNSPIIYNNHYRGVIRKTVGTEMGLKTRSF